MEKRSRKRGRKRDGDGVVVGRELIPICRLGPWECATPDAVSLSVFKTDGEPTLITEEGGQLFLLFS